MALDLTIGNVANTLAGAGVQPGTSTTATATNANATPATAGPVTMTPPPVAPKPLPVSTTTLSSANKQSQVPQIQATTNKLATDSGIKTDATGVPHYANGTIFINGVAVQPDNSTGSTGTSGGLDANPNPPTTDPYTTSTGGYYGELYIPPGGQIPKDAKGLPVALTPMSPTDETILKGLNDAKASADAMTASIIDSITKQYEGLIASQKQTNSSAEANVNTALLMGGVTGQGSSSQFAPISSAGIIQSQVTYGLAQIADLQNKEAMAIVQAQQAGQNADFQLMDKINTQINKIRDEKVAAATKLNDTITTAKSQATLDSAVNKLYSSGITDSSAILSEIKKQGLVDQNGVPYTAKAVADSLTSIKPTADELNRQKDARDFAIAHGIIKPFYLVGNTAVSTETGEKVDLPTYQRLTGQKVGLPESQTDFSFIDNDVQPTGKYTASTDAFGNPIVFNTVTGKFEDGNGNPVSSHDAPTIPNGNGVTYDQYGLLANTDFNPDNQIDQAANLYLDRYLKSGTEPSARTLGLGTKANMASIAQRANDLYFAATGEPMPTPEIIKGNQKLINSNNSFANNLKIQEQTVKQNFGLNLENLQKNDLNTSGNNAVNNFLDNIKQFWLGNPEAAQYALQNATVQNEIGSLLAVRNATGTTVHDKLEASGLLPKGASFDQQKAMLKTLMQEADNAKKSLVDANADLYKQIDPLQQSPSNPARQQTKENDTLDGYLRNNPNSYDSAEKILNENPNLTDQDVLDIIRGKVNEGSGSNNAKPTSYNNLQNRNLSFAPKDAVFTSVKIGAGAAIANNNPGNLRNIDGSWQKFATPSDGFKALMGYVERAKQGDQKRYNSNQSLYQFFSIYAPSADKNNPKQYAEAVAKQLGVSPNTTIGKLNTLQLAKAIAKHDSSTQVA